MKIALHSSSNYDVMGVTIPHHAQPRRGKLIHIEGLELRILAPDYVELRKEKGRPWSEFLKRALDALLMYFDPDGTVIINRWTYQDKSLR